MVDGLRATLYDGTDVLEVVGESFRQDAIWATIGREPTTMPVRQDVVALLVPEVANPHDVNAVWVAGHHVGYLAADDALAYRPGVLRLIESGGPIAIRGIVTGGGRGGMAILGV